MLDRIAELTSNVLGEGVLMTWKDSRWLLSVVIPAQPHFADQKPGTSTLWGYALFGALYHGIAHPQVAWSALQTAFA